MKKNEMKKESKKYVEMRKALEKVAFQSCVELVQHTRCTDIQMLANGLAVRIIITEEAK